MKYLFMYVYASMLNQDQMRDWAKRLKAKTSLLIGTVLINT